MKAIYKFNSGMGALLCSKCRTIMKTNSEFTDMEWIKLTNNKLEAQYCDKCKKE